MNKTADDMIAEVEVVKGGHVTHLVVQGMDGRVEKCVFPFDSVPPSMVVVSRKALVEKLEEMIDENAGMRALLDHQDAELRQPNLPLTFEQLKERIGKPVYRRHRGGASEGWTILTDLRETRKSGGEVVQEIKIAPHYIREYVAFNPELVEYYDHEVTQP